MSIKTKHVIFHDYRWDGEQVGPSIDPDQAILYAWLLYPEEFGVAEGLNQLFPGILKMDHQNIILGLDRAPGYTPELLQDPSTFDGWLEEIEAVCWDCGGGFGNSNRIWDNTPYREGLCAAARIFKAMTKVMAKTDQQPTKTIKMWVEAVNSSDTTRNRYGAVIETIPAATARVNIPDNGRGKMTYRQAMNWLAENLMYRFLADLAVEETGSQLATHQLEGLPFPLEINGIPIYIGPSFAPHTARAARSPHGGNCGITITQMVPQDRLADPTALKKPGKIQISTHQGQNIDLGELVKLVRNREAQEQGVWSPETTEEMLAMEEYSPVDNGAWFYLDWGYFSNGGTKLNIPKVLSCLNLSQILNYTRIAFDPSRFYHGSDRYPPCPKDSCRGRTCPWFSNYLDRCKKLRA